ncbi:MAG: cysteine desulfurase family protein [Bdellovibrionales bacterium]
MSKNFFDYNSTTPVCPEALKAMLPYFSDIFANPSAQTSKMSWQSQSAIKLAKSQISSLIECHGSEIIFTSGATESINWVFEDFLKRGLPVLVSDIDHDASFQKAEQTHVFKSNPDGTVNLESFKEALKDMPKGSLVSLIHAHNELGTILNLQELIPLIKEKELFVHLDSTQALGKFEFSFSDLEIDFLSCSAHKVYGPKGLGALIINKNIVSNLKPLILGGGQQNGMRSGTLNTPLIVGFGKACEVAQKSMASDITHYSELKKIFLDEIKDCNHKLNGDVENSLVNTVNVSFFDWTSLAPLYLELLPFSVSQSSACSTESNKKRILSSLGIPEAQTLRVSFGRGSDRDSVLNLARKILETLKK